MDRPLSLLGVYTLQVGVTVVTPAGLVVLLVGVVYLGGGVAVGVVRCR